jgi:hypothetical protein
MRHFLTRTGLAVAAVILGVFVQALPARAQFVQVYSSPVVVAPAPVVSYYPSVSYYAPATSYYAPATSYYAPVTSYYAPAVSYSYYPPTTFYSAPAAVVGAGTVTTRTYVGYGIFRPRGVYTQNYYTPGPVVVPTTSFYSPVYVP